MFLVLFIVLSGLKGGGRNPSESRRNLPVTTVLGKISALPAIPLHIVQFPLLLERARGNWELASVNTGRHPEKRELLTT